MVAVAPDIVVLKTNVRFLKQNQDTPINYSCELDDYIKVAS